VAPTNPNQLYAAVNARERVKVSQMAVALADMPVGSFMFALSFSASTQPACMLKKLGLYQWFNGQEWVNRCLAGTKVASSLPAPHPQISYMLAQTRELHVFPGYRRCMAQQNWRTIPASD
jgi:hypothetical protein